MIASAKRLSLQRYLGKLLAAEIEQQPRAARPRIVPLYLLCLRLLVRRVSVPSGIGRLHSLPGALLRACRAVFAVAPSRSQAAAGLASDHRRVEWSRGSLTLFPLFSCGLALILALPLGAAARAVYLPRGISDRGLAAVKAVEIFRHFS